VFMKKKSRMGILDSDGKSPFSNRLLLVVFCILSNYVFCQPLVKRVDISKIIENEKLSYLQPPFITNDTTECIAFIVDPEVKSNASFRIIETKGKSYLEVRCLDKNIKVELWKRLFEEKVIDPQSRGVHSIHMVLRENRDTTPLPIKTLFYSVPISDSFRNKMLNVFLKVKELNKYETKVYDEGKIITTRFDVFDGSFYRFLVNTNGKMEGVGILVGEDDPYNPRSNESSDVTYLVKLTNVKIINDMRNGIFKESNYDIYK